MSSKTTQLSIALVPGDGIGVDVSLAAQVVVDAALRLHDRPAVAWTTYPWGCDYYASHGQMMPADGLELLGGHDAILLGAVGSPGVPDHESLWGLLIPIRRAFGQYVNLRPLRLLDGVRSPLSRLDAERDVDVLIVRENSEGEYSQVGGRAQLPHGEEAAYQQAQFSHTGCRRIIEFAFARARERRGHVTGATKSNGIVHTATFWDEIFRSVAAAHPDVEARLVHVDALAAQFVLAPERFDVVVASNLMGDILSDLGAAVVGAIGIAPSANLDPTGRHPSMFEPIHGSAPDIAGQGIANPAGAVWSAALMLEHLGHDEVARSIMVALESVTSRLELCTPDLGGTSTTEQMTSSLLEALTVDHELQEA